jgi:hypothetical protein
LISSASKRNSGHSVTHIFPTVRNIAFINKTENGWRAQVSRQGIRKSKVLPTQRAAKDWAARIEFEILNGDKLEAWLRRGELFDRYAREVSPTKRGERWEVIRLKKFQTDVISKVHL